MLRTDVMQPNKMQAFEHHPRNEIWRSETIITIFVDTWLNNDQVINCDYFFHKALNVSLPFYKVNDCLEHYTLGIFSKSNYFYRKISKSTIFQLANTLE